MSIHPIVCHTTSATRPLQCEVQQRNFLKTLPVQQRNILQLQGIWGSGSTNDTILASFGAWF